MYQCEVGDFVNLKFHQQRTILYHWYIMGYPIVYPTMDATAICLSWDKHFVLTTLGQAVVYAENLLQKNLQQNTQIS